MVTCLERVDLLALLYVMFYCVFVTFPCADLGQVWCLFVSIPDLCLLSCFTYNKVHVCPSSTKYWDLQEEKLNFMKSNYNISKGAKIRNRCNQVPHLTQDTNGKVTNSQQTPQTRAKRSAFSQQLTTKHI